MSDPDTHTSGTRAFDPAAITRPDDSLLTYYVIVSALTLFAAPFVFIPLFIRYKTLRYQIDGEGISMKWGLLFRREVYLTYRRIQDIHVTRNIIERWMGLAKIPVQTASGTSGATMRIEGIRDPEPLRDFLYQRMRGARGHDHPTPAAPTEAIVAPPTSTSGTRPAEDPTQLLRDIHEELKRIRRRLEGDA